MCKYKVRGKSGNSTIKTGNYLNLLKEFNVPEDAIYITDSNIYKLYDEFLKERKTIVIPAGDSNKTLESVELIYEKLISFGADRKSYIVGFGGGMITDIAGFAASTYMRGIKFGFISTSLLGMVDASVGGKNGVNFQRFKNMIGNFNQPEFVILDSDFFKTLPREEYINGMAEAIKHYLIADKSGYKNFKENSTVYLDKDNGELDEFLCKQIKIKIDVVNKDEKETGERKKLNFGHTFGHAIEKLTGIKHGYAVSIGIVIAAKISQKLGFLSDQEVNDIKISLELSGLPVTIKLSKKEIIQAMHKDKKKDGENIHFIALECIGKAKVISMKIKELENLFLSLD